MVVKGLNGAAAQTTSLKLQWSMGTEVQWLSNEDLEDSSDFFQHLV